MTELTLTEVDESSDPSLQDELGELGIWVAENQVEQRVLDTVFRLHQPSAAELLRAMEKELGPKVRWVIETVIERLCDCKELTQIVRNYLKWMLASGELREALNAAPDAAAKHVKPFESTLDDLIHRSSAYRSSAAFAEMVRFMAQFRDYAPFNNMLVKVQNPACGFFATQKDWRIRFGRYPIEDARPMLILAPMRPVMLVYDVDQTEGNELPKELREFGKFEGEWKPEWLERAVDNAARHDRIKIDFKSLSSSNAGFATTDVSSPLWKMRIAIHDKMDEPSRFGVVCHELAHIYLGHLGADGDGWWPCRQNLTLSSIEIEAEAVAFIVTSRFGLSGGSDRYLSRYASGDKLPPSVSLELIGKVAGRVEDMCRRSLPERAKKQKAS
ncbi:MAG: hypothetical protein K8R87_13880 [Verrucomicrobia bacterium]|nr:hypothetical protein [Verrucomicrobiota bacterium]